MRCTLVDDKTERLLHAISRGLYPAIYNIISILLTMSVSSATSERSLSPMRRMKFYLRSTIVDEWLSNLSLMHIHTTIYTSMCKSTWIWFLGTFHKLIQVKKSSESNLYQTCILFFLSALKFRRVHIKVTIRPAARGLSE